MKLSLAVAIAAVILASCKNNQSAQNTTQTGATQTPPAATAPSMGGGASGQMPAVAGSRSDSGLAFTLPQGWTRVPPASSMRLDQATIPGSGGNGELAVFFFGPGQGGTVDANLDRWAAQMETTQKPSRETFEVGALRVTWMDVSGTLMPSGMGMGPTSPQPDSRMLAAVVEGQGGPWFFKATGPSQTMAEQRDAFIAMLKSVKVQAPAV